MIVPLEISHAMVLYVFYDLQPENKAGPILSTLESACGSVALVDE